jgi:hypothetical protein
MTTVSEGLLQSGGVDTNTAKSLGESVSSLMTPKLGNSSDTDADLGEVAEGTFRNVSKVVDNLLNAQILGQFVGEAPTEMITENLKTSVSKVSLSKLEGSTFSTPTSRDEKESNYRPALVALQDVSEYYDRDCSIGVSMAELGLHKREDTTNIDTSVTRFGMGCFSSSRSSSSRENKKRELKNNGKRGKMQITIQNTADRATGAAGTQGAPGASEAPQVSEEMASFIVPENITISCEWGFKGNQTLFCPNSTVPHTRWCNGEGREWKIPCQSEVVYDKPTCALSSHLGPWKDTSCTVLTSNKENITCLCDILDSVITDIEKREDKRRQLLKTEDVDIGETSSIDVVGLVGSATKSFIATWSVATKLNVDLIAKNIFVFYVMGSTLVLTVVLFIVGYALDTREKRKEQENLSSSTSVDHEVGKSRDRTSTLMAESAPKFSKYVYKKMSFAKLQLATHHPYLEVILAYKKGKSRPQRVALLATSFLTILFVEAVLYKYSYPDDPPGCVSYTSQADCEVPMNYWDTNRNRCLWTKETYSCSFIEPTVTFLGSLVMSTLAIIVSSVPIFFLVLIFNKTIFPKVKKRQKRKTGGLSTQLSEMEDDVEEEFEEENPMRKDEPSVRDETKLRKRDIVKGQLANLEIGGVVSEKLMKMKNRR